MEKSFAIDSLDIEKINYSRNKKKLHVHINEPLGTEKAEVVKTHLKKKLGFLNEIEFIFIKDHNKPSHSFRDFTDNYKSKFPYLNGIIANIELKNESETNSEMIVHLLIDNEMNRNRIQQIILKNCDGKAPLLSFKSIEENRSFLTD